MKLQLNDLLDLGDKSFGKEFELDDVEAAKLRKLGDRLKKCGDVLKPFLHNSTSGLRLLLFDVETDEADRDDVRLVGVLTYPDLKILQYDHRLSRVELETLIGGASVVIFTAFNNRFDLPRAFDETAKKVLLRRTTKIGSQKSSYLIYRGSRGEIGYSLDIMMLAHNLLDEKKWSLWDQTRSNIYFQKLETEDYLHLKYNAYDLLSEFELLVRVAEKASEFLEALNFTGSDIIDFILRQYRFEPIESHMSPLKLFEVGSRIAKALAAPYARFPSFPALYMGGRVRAWDVGRFKNVAFLDINSQYPGIMSRLSPNTMRLVYGKEATRLVKYAIELIREYGPIEAFRQLYVEQRSPTLLLSTWVLVQFRKDGLWKVEVLKEKGKKSRKLSLYTMVYRNRRQEQARVEGFVRFRAGEVYNFPLYFLFLQSKEQLKRIKVLDAAGFTVKKDPEWTARWEMLYRMRKENPDLSTSLKVVLNAVTGLLGDVDQAFSNLAIGGHVTAFSRTVSHMIERELGEEVMIYHDTDGYAVKAEAEDKLRTLLNKLSPWGCKKEYDGATELVVMRTKRYALRMPDGSWITKGTERSGYGRERNRMLSFLNGTERRSADDIRQVSKQKKTPHIPAVQELLKDSETGEWCYYFSYPLSRSARLRQQERKWYFALEDFLEELESGGSGESLEHSLNNYVRRVAKWAGFTKNPSKKYPKSRWCLELFEHLRAYGFSSKEDIYKLVKRKVGIDLEVVRAHLLVEEYDAGQENVIRDYADADAKVTYAITKNRRVYFACKLKEPLIDLANKLIPLPPAKLKFQASSLEENIPAKVFAPILGKPDTTFLEAQISLASLLNIPMATPEKMRLLSKTIGAMGRSDNYGVKLAVETLRIHQGEISDEDPYIIELPRRARKRSPFSQRRFYLIQRFPYKVRYHISWDAVKGAQFRRKKFIFRDKPVWLPRALSEITSLFFRDVKLLEARLNQAFKMVVQNSGNILFKWLGEDVKLHIVPYARYIRFDVAYDIPHTKTRDLIEEFEDICERNGYDYRKGLGFIGLNGKALTDSRYIVPGNIVLYDRNTRFNLKTNSFLRKYKPFVQSWRNDRVGRLEIQCFARRSNNRKANPLASLLNVLELFRLQAPALFNFFEKCLSVITNMLHDPPEGSGMAGAKEPTSPQKQTNHTYTYLAGLGLGPPEDETLLVQSRINEKKGC